MDADGWGWPHLGLTSRAPAAVSGGVCSDCLVPGPYCLSNILSITATDDFGLIPGSFKSPFPQLGSPHKDRIKERDGHTLKWWWPPPQETSKTPVIKFTLDGLMFLVYHRVTERGLTVLRGKGFISMSKNEILKEINIWSLCLKVADTFRGI